MLEDAVSNNQKENFRDLNVQLWRHTTYKALLSTPDHSAIWKQYIDETMTYLRQLLECFRAAPHFESSMNKFETAILTQASKIHQDMTTSMQRYSFHVETYNESNGRRARVDSLLSNHANSIKYTGNQKDAYHNVLAYMKRTDVRNTDRAELDEHLDPLCTVRPRLRCRTLGGETGNNFSKLGEEINVTGTVTLVVYGDGAKKQEVQMRGSSLFSRIYKVAAQ
ncbi:hypothetical protein F4782DRAFT_510424 [Xylaria castorea]|nr:hypothetical protein F4782DRAFT_510424 [Xylaria castorea]